MNRNALIQNYKHVQYTNSSSRMHVMNHDWSATKQQSVAEISHHSVFSGDRIWQCVTSSVVRDPQVWKLNKNGWTGHGMVYFSNASFPLAWTLRIYVWLVCSAKFPAKNNSGQFCKRTVQFLYENYVFCFFQIHVVWMLCLKQNAS